jgi:hypothetical protein
MRTEENPFNHSAVCCRHHIKRPTNVVVAIDVQIRF